VDFLVEDGEILSQLNPVNNFGFHCLSADFAD